MLCVCPCSMSSTCVHISLYAHIHMHKFATSSLYIFIFIHESIYVIFSATTLENSFIWLFGNKSVCHHSLYGHEGLPISAITQQSFHDILWHVTKPQLNTTNMSIWRNDVDVLCRSHIYHVYPSGVAIRFLFYLPYETERPIIYGSRQYSKNTHHFILTNVYHVFIVDMFQAKKYDCSLAPNSIALWTNSFIS